MGSHFFTFAEIGFYWQNMIDNRGPMMALMGMGIVFVALAVISLFIAVLPRLIGADEEAEHAHAPPAAAPKAADDDAALAAAIGFVLHKRRRDGG